MKDTLLSTLQLGLRAAMIAAKNRNGNFQALIQLFEATGPRQWLALLVGPIVAWGRSIAVSAQDTGDKKQQCHG